MKKFFYLLMIVSLFFLNCAKDNKNQIIEVRERMFVTQVNDIYLNEKFYLGKTIKIEGIFMNDNEDNQDENFYAVYRFGPGGCCGIDGIIGLEVVWNSNKNNRYPLNDEWVEAVGELKKYETNTLQNIYIELKSLKVLNERGNEYVSM